MYIINSNVIELGTNYRSKDEIIKFNNLFFNHIGENVFSSEIHKNIYINCTQKSNGNKGGICWSKYNKNGSNLKKKRRVKQIIEESVYLGQLQDICVLVRTNNQGIEISDYLNSENIEIISSETLLMSKSEEVKFIVEVLKFCTNPNWGA